MALSPENKKRMTTAAIVIGIAIAAYLIYRWWQNRQSNSGSSTGLDTTGDGSNLNSVAPNLVAGGSTGGSGLDYTSPNYDINLTLPNGNGPVDATSPSANSAGSPNPPVGSTVPAPPAKVTTPAAPTITVPNVVGKSLVQAQVQLNGMGLKYAGPRGIPAGTKVKTESPKAGTKVPKGTIVTVGK